MFFAHQISLKELARLCRRLATSLEAGVEIRKTWKREAEGHVPAAVRAELRKISEAVDRGESVIEALGASGEFFPKMFRELVAVGEQTGQLPEVLRRLADHYDHQLTLRRDFLGQITWPVIQLVAAVMIVGFLIWILGAIASSTGGPPLDVLGLGLVGTQGAMIYFAGVGGLVFAAWFAYVFARRSLTGSRILHRAILATPALGSAVRTLCLSRLAWSLHLTQETGMGLREALPLALRSTNNTYFADQSPAVVDSIMAGGTLTSALSQEGGYPRDFIDTLEVGEESGRLSESMAKLSEQYQDQAQRAMATLTMLAGFGVWALIAMLIIVVIIRIFMVAYLGPINRELDML